ncbi:hypothetical protein [Legionella worsleiensis]|uniref:Ankyrin repeats (3 copies) n=1 Tax=Legionella worsleiensis TaxID=45076 RepID=A0A0W1AF55_9GAMM|nr:hypothetical protein [Legionella worsleiensis]KTD79962.1 Ankyrin repeats (3 copies) [Legionella worsleiensis]STY32433.1 Ankyrin repeats (3 copies) [Legionella worsleiensis]
MRSKQNLRDHATSHSVSASTSDTTNNALSSYNMTADITNPFAQGIELERAIHTKDVIRAMELFNQGTHVTKRAAIEAARLIVFFPILHHYLDLQEDGSMHPDFFYAVYKNAPQIPSEYSETCLKLYRSLIQKSNPAGASQLFAEIGGITNCIDIPVLTIFREFKWDLSLFSVSYSVKSIEVIDFVWADLSVSERAKAFERAVELKHLSWVEEKLLQGFPIPSGALSAALRNNHSAMFDLLMQYKAPFDQFTIAAAVMTNDIPLVTRLLDLGAPLTGYALNIALVCNNETMMNFLIQMGARPNSDVIRTAFYKNLYDLGINLLELYGLDKTVDYLLDINPDTISDEHLDRLFAIISKCDHYSALRLVMLEPESRALHYLNRFVNEKQVTIPDQVFSYAAEQNKRSIIDFYLSHVKPGQRINICKILKSNNDYAIQAIMSIPDFKLYLNEQFLVAYGSDPALAVLPDMFYQSLQKDIHPFHADKFTLQAIETVFNDLYDLIIYKRKCVSHFESVEDYAPLIAQYFMYAPNYELNFCDWFLLSACMRSIKTVRWEMIFPEFDLPEPLQNLSPFGFDPQVYEQLLVITRKAALIEADPNSELNAYKLTVLFGSFEQAQLYLEHFKGRRRPVHDACIFGLPNAGVWDIESWRNLLINSEGGYYRKVFNFIPLAPVLERVFSNPLPSWKSARNHLDHHPHARFRTMTVASYYHWLVLDRMQNHPDYQGRLPAITVGSSRSVSSATRPVRMSKQDRKQQNALVWEALQAWMPQDMAFFAGRQGPPPLTEFFNRLEQQARFDKMTARALTGIVVSKLYHTRPIDPKYMDYAFECAAAGVSAQDFFKTLSIIERGPKQVSYIPKFSLDGSLIHHDEYVIETMSDIDPMIFLLGKKTACCQSINGHSRDCVLHGAKTPYGGFIRIMKKNTHNPWVAQSWVGLTSRNEIVFDSIEWNKWHDERIILALYELAATYILMKDQRICKVLFGKGGNTPQAHKYQSQNEEPARIIGYKDIGYDSINERFILAQQGYLNPALHHVLQSVPPVHYSCDMTDDGFVLATGKDTFVNEGKTRRGLSLNTLSRNAFFATRPQVHALLKANKANPLLEEGYYSKSAKGVRERIGEYFLTFKAIEAIWAMKKGQNPVYQDFPCILVDNDSVRVSDYLRDNPLKSEGRVAIGFVDDIHATAAYIECIDGCLYGQIVDSEPGDLDDSLLAQAIRQALPGITLYINTERLKVDYYSCATFMIKSLMFFAKQGHTLWEYAKQGRLPPALLKMAQRIDFSKLDAADLNQIVSTHKKQSLQQYVDQHECTFVNKSWNGAAIRAKYRWLARLAETQNDSVCASSSTTHIARMNLL